MLINNKLLVANRFCIEDKVRKSTNRTRLEWNARSWREGPTKLTDKHATAATRSTNMQIQSVIWQQNNWWKLKIWKLLILLLKYFLRQTKQCSGKLKPKATLEQAFEEKSIEINCTDYLNIKSNSFLKHFIQAKNLSFDRFNLS